MKTNQLLAGISFALLALLALAAPLHAQPVVAITAPDADAAETLAGQTPNPGLFRISRTGSTAISLTVSVRVTGVAVQGVDYVFGIGTIGSVVTIPAGAANLDIPLNVLDDFLTEGLERVQLEILAAANPAYYTVSSANNKARFDIADNEDPLAPARAQLTVAAIDDAAAETSNGVPNTATFRITREGNTTVALNINYALGGTAINGVDYATLSGQIAMPANALTADVVVTPIDDLEIEGDETVTFSFLPSGITNLPPPAEAYAVALVSNTASAVIHDNDFYPPPVLTVTSPTASSVGIVGQPFTVSFTASSAGAWITSWYLSGGTNGASGINTNTTLDAPFSASAQIAFASAIFSSPVTVAVTDSRTNTTYISRSVYVINPPPPPPPPPTFATFEVIAVDAEAAETDAGETPNPGKFLIVQRGTPGNFQFYFPTFSGTARQGVDYNYAWGATTTSTNGGTNIVTREVLINPINDYFIEPTETVRLQLVFPIITFIESGGAGAPTGSYVEGDATLNLLDNDTNAAPFSVLSVTASDADAAEVSALSGQPQNPGAFTITRTAPLTNALMVNFSLGGTAKNGVDFETISNSAVIPAGASSVQVNVNPIYDTLAEGNETVTLALQPTLIAPPDPASYLLDEGATNNAATVILRDYAPTNLSIVKITATDPVAVEHYLGIYRRNAHLLVSRVGNVSAPLTVNYDIGGTAANGVDYATLSGFVNFTNGATGVDIAIVPVADGTVEAFETVVLALQQPALDVFPPPYLMGSPATAGATIRDYLSYSSRRFAIRHYPKVRYRYTHFTVPVPVQAVTTALVTNAAVVSSVPVTNNTPCWTIEASTNMVNWVSVGTSDSSTAAGAVDGFVDTDAGNFAQRFYRTRPCGTTP